MWCSFLERALFIYLDVSCLDRAPIFLLKPLHTCSLCCVTSLESLRVRSRRCGSLGLLFLCWTVTRFWPHPLHSGAEPALIELHCVQANTHTLPAMMMQPRLCLKQSRGHRRTSAPHAVMTNWPLPYLHAAKIMLHKTSNYFQEESALRCSSWQSCVYVSVEC